MVKNIKIQQNKKGQFDLEITPGIIILTVIGAALGLFVAKLMHAGLMLKIITMIACAIASFIMAKFIASR